MFDPATTNERRRFCDSPTSDVESRQPKGRAKRGRGAAGTPVPGLGGVGGVGGVGGLGGHGGHGGSGGGSGGHGGSALGHADPSLSPMHSKLRNGAKGRRPLPAPPSPAKETPGGKRKVIFPRPIKRHQIQPTYNTTKSNSVQPRKTQ